MSDPQRMSVLPHMKTKIAASDILSAFEPQPIGTKVLDLTAFLAVASAYIEAYDFASQRVPGQGFIMCPDAVPFVSAGVGPKSSNPNDYILREHRGVVSAYLRREHAAPVEGCALVVYTTDAYLADPDVTPEEAARIRGLEASHVIVAVLAFAGPKSPLSPYRFVWNLAGGNREAATWSADEIRAKAKEIIDYDNVWAPVAG